MTPEQQRAKIAELQGWSEITHGAFGQCYGTAPFDSMMDDRQIGMPVPSYTTDLNACYEMEKALTDEQDLEYSESLEQVVGAHFNANNGEDMRRLRSATAAQRAEAFLRTLGKWEDDK